MTAITRGVRGKLREICGHVHYAQCFRKKQPLCFLVITSANINRFSKFFHLQIFKKTVWVAMISFPPYLNYVATLPCEIRKFTITAKHVNQYVSKCSNVQSECSKCPPPAATQAASRLRHSLIALSITSWFRRSHSSSTRWRSSSTSVILCCLCTCSCRIPPHRVVDGVQIRTVIYDIWEEEGIVFETRIY